MKVVAMSLVERTEDQTTLNEISGIAHWTRKGDVPLFLWEKRAQTEPPSHGTILFVHGSSMSALPTFDLQVFGAEPTYSAMDWFAGRGFDTWCVDLEGYGRSGKARDINFDIANGVEDLVAATDYIMAERDTGPLLIYGISSGALRGALFAQQHPDRVARLVLDAMVWTGHGSPTLNERRKNIDRFVKQNRRPIDRAFVQSVFDRDHPGCAEQAAIDAFADAILHYDDSMPTGTYVDMCTKLPVVDPEQIAVPTAILRGEFDGIATMGDLVEFFIKLPNPDKQFSVMPGISHASFQQKNRSITYHLLEAFLRVPRAQFLG
ncbi:alpha/beta hydrolase [Mesorhizobium sp. 1B3]|uniref:alpha/beta hydrolase n=1 Tax=Mesorhizobium sp. 1B3 TaxID=3243599 RepID=UPI003D995374